MNIEDVLPTQQSCTTSSSTLFQGLLPHELTRYYHKILYYFGDQINFPFTYFPIVEEKTSHVNDCVNLF